LDGSEYRKGRENLGQPVSGGTDPGRNAHGFAVAPSRSEKPKGKGSGTRVSSDEEEPVQKAIRQRGPMAEQEVKVVCKRQFTLAKFASIRDSESDDEREPIVDAGEDGARTITWSLPPTPQFPHRDPRAFVKRNFGLTDLVTAATGKQTEARPAAPETKPKKK
jgi:hypothetical protein